jgi:hypothetical protein
VVWHPDIATASSKEKVRTTFMTTCLLIELR